MHPMDRNSADHPPNIFAPRKEDRETFADLGDQDREQIVAIADRKKAARVDFTKWLATAEFQSTPADSTLALHLHSSLPDGTIRGLVDGNEREWKSDVKTVAAPGGYAPVVSDTPVILGDLGSFERKDQVTFGGFIRVEGSPTGAVIARMKPSDAYRGWDIYLQNGRIASHVIHSWQDKANKFVSTEVLKPGTWKHVMVSFDGTKKPKETMKLFIDGVPAKFDLSPSSVGGKILTDAALILGSRDEGDSKLSGGTVALQDFRFYRRLLSDVEISKLANDSLVQELLNKPTEQRTKEDTELLFTYYFERVDPKAAAIRKKIQTIKREREEIKKRGSLTLIMQEKKEPPFAHLLIRGVYSDKGDKVDAETPSFLPPMPDDSPRNRLGLAQWLVSKENPLTARVTMNRLWHQMFGTGIVETVEDFGVMGARPSHPRLLDWLASEFMESGWDHRHMVKTIVTSAAYRQSGQVSPEKLELDPANRLISRGPRYRLDAEVIRDLALVSSGLLSGKVGGPSVKPYQPNGVWEAVAMKESTTRFYKQDKGESLYRRSLYTLWKRTAHHPAMEILNAPSREVFCVRRELTNTPLQAFVTLNDPQFVEASRHLAQHALIESSDDSTRIDFISLKLISRTLNADEKKIVLRTLSTARERFSKEPNAATELITIGDSKADSSLDAPELAAWTIIASQILNLDETLNK